MNFFFIQFSWIAVRKASNNSDRFEIKKSHTKENLKHHALQAEWTTAKEEEKKNNNATKENIERHYFSIGRTDIRTQTFSYIANIQTLIYNIKRQPFSGFFSLYVRFFPLVHVFSLHVVFFVSFPLRLKILFVNIFFIFIFHTVFFLICVNKINFPSSQFCFVQFSFPFSCISKI